MNVIQAPQNYEAQLELQARARGSVLRRARGLSVGVLPERRSVAHGGQFERLPRPESRDRSTCPGMLGRGKRERWEEPTWATADRSQAWCRLTLRLVVTSSELNNWDGERDAREVVETAYGADVLAADPYVGAPTLRLGSIGRGGELSTVLLEWIVEPAAKGVVGLAAAQSLKRLIERSPPSGRPTATSRSTECLSPPSYEIPTRSISTTWASSRGSSCCYQLMLGRGTSLW